MAYSGEMDLDLSTAAGRHTRSDQAACAGNAGVQVDS